MDSMRRCRFCGAGLVRVDGVLGPQLFCPACRRFHTAQDRKTNAPARRPSH